MGGASACAWPCGAARRRRDSPESCLQPLAVWPDGAAMELEPESLLQEARENVEAAQTYRRELGQRLQGLREARRQVGGPRQEGRYGARGLRAMPGGWARAMRAPRGGSVRKLWR